MKKVRPVAIIVEYVDNDCEDGDEPLLYYRFNRDMVMEYGGVMGILSRIAMGFYMTMPSPPSIEEEEPSPGLTEQELDEIMKEHEENPPSS